MADSLYKAFDRCVELVRQGVPPEECLARYPEHGAELGPLLMAATSDASELGHGMGPAAGARVRSRVMASWDLLHSRQARRWTLPLFAPRWAVAGALLALVVVLGGTGTTLAARGAVPGGALYPVKQLQEEARVWLARSPEAKTAAYTGMVRERAAEIRKLAGTDQAGPTSIALDRLEQHIRDVSRIASRALEQGEPSVDARAPALVGTLQEVVIEQAEVAELVRETIGEAPANAYPCLVHSLETIQEARDKVRAAVEGIGGDLPDSRSARGTSNAGLCPG